MKYVMAAKCQAVLLVGSIVMFGEVSCKKSDGTDANNKPKADFTFKVKNQGAVPDTVSFSSAATNAGSLHWDFGNGTNSTVANPNTVYTAPGKYNVKLIASNQYGADSITKQILITLNKPTSNFNFTIRNQGFLPDTVDFVSITQNASSLKWYFGDGKTDTTASPRHVFTKQGTYKVALVATNAAGSDSISKELTLILNKPVVDFDFTTSTVEVLPVSLTTTNRTIGSNITYTWSFGSGTSNQVNPIHNFRAGGIYNIKLVASNESGSDSMTKELRISPYIQTYTNFNGITTNKYAWEGGKVLILSRTQSLNRITMFKWLKAMDSTYEYYKTCTGREPIIYAPTYLNGRTTIADVRSTCGAGCSYLGFTGIELQNSYFDIMYNAITNANEYDQVAFYEFGRNFWFYGDQLAYKFYDPIATGYAVFMRFMAMEAAKVNGAPFGPWSFSTFQTKVENLIDSYLADPSLNWSNTLGVGQGVPNSELGGTDLFASFCFRLRRDYGGDTFVKNLWKQAGLRPYAVTTQDAVDNFVLAASAAANKNLVTLFQSWKWTVSDSAIAEAAKYP